MFNRLILLFMVTIIVTINIPGVSAEENLIIRKILTDISWSETEEGTKINLDYIVIKKVGDQETSFGPNTYFIYATDLSYQNLNEERIDNYLKESGSENFVHNEDVVYGNYLRIFADVRDEKLTKQQLETLTNEAIAEVNTYYEQKDEILAGTITLNQENDEATEEGQISIYLWIMSYIFVMFGISMLMKFFKRRK